MDVGSLAMRNGLGTTITSLRGHAIVLVAAALGSACQPLARPRATASDPPPTPTHGALGAEDPDAPRFSGAAALARIEALMTWPRALGDPRRGRSIDALERMLVDAGADRVDRQEFVASGLATTESFALVNLFAQLRPDAPRRFVLATHFDTRPWADEEADRSLHDQPIPGANDGTSGVAVLLELMPTLARSLPPDVGITVILFDGEELGRPGMGGQGGYCIGSRHFAAEAAREPPAWLASAELGIVLDMVGDRDLHVRIEPGAMERVPALVERLWTVARERGHVQFEDRVRASGVLDDHAFLGEAGVPSVLLIDREYAPWHTLGDTIDQVSADSLAAVGDTVLYTLLELAASPTP